ncbi:8-oxo-dGTP diphosphatase [Kitasatospora sp. MAA19]|uniref:NUDIX hydrolase n=1 Tax=unclassified Kitasatospora TaxID=2633591 RepID=UPI0024761FDE|nr:NUDIX hydrolase [Kitasatospora sp. MAA19]MDH6710014.1 8-oxo-dGTP diphosphatase [Kitasatospora sp. MAA19]
MTDTWLSEQDWLAGLLRAYVGCSVLLTDRVGNVLLLKASYRAQWQFPGGAMDPGEGPADCAARELCEETGLVAEGLRLLVVEWRDPIPGQGEHAYPAVQFMFDGGTVGAGAAVRVQVEEIADYGYFTPAQASALLHPCAARRLTRALEARRTGATALLHSAGYVG